MTLFQVRSRHKHDGATSDLRWLTQLYAPLRCAVCGHWAHPCNRMPAIQLEAQSAPLGVMAPLMRTGIEILRRDFFECWQDFLEGYCTGAIESNLSWTHSYLPVWASAQVFLPLASDAVLRHWRCRLCGRICINARWEESTWIPRASIGDRHIYSGFGGTDFYVKQHVLDCTPQAFLDELQIQEVELRDTDSPYGPIFLCDNLS